MEHENEKYATAGAGAISRGTDGMREAQARRDEVNQIEDRYRREQDMMKMASINAGSRRYSAREMIQQKIQELHGAIEELTALHNALPLELPPAADRALWALVLQIKARP